MTKKKENVKETDISENKEIQPDKENNGHPKKSPVKTITIVVLCICLIFFICALVLSVNVGIKNPPNIFSSSISNFAIFCIIPDFQTAHMSYIDIKIKTAIIDIGVKIVTNTAAIPG